MLASGPPSTVLRAAAAVVVRDLARAVEIGVQRRQEHEVVIARPVRVLPGVVDHVDLDVGRQQGRDERSDLGLERAAVMPAAAVIVGEHGNDANPHRSSPGSFSVLLARAAPRASVRYARTAGCASRLGSRSSVTPEPARLDYRLRAVVDVQRPQDSSDVDLHRAFGELEPAADQLVRQALEDAGEDLGLAVGQAQLARRRADGRRHGRGRRTRGRRIGADGRRRDVDAAGKHEPQRLQHDGVGRALRDVAHRAHVERAEHVNVALGGRQHHDRNGRMRGAEVGEELEPVGAGQRRGRGAAGSHRDARRSAGGRPPPRRRRTPPARSRAGRGRGARPRGSAGGRRPPGS